MKHYFIFAGEASGDLHGSHLIQSLKSLTPLITFSGVGGPAMRAQGLDFILKMEEFQVMGFSDVLKSLPKLWKNFYKVCDSIIKSKPDCVILIDYPGFNLRLAKKLRKQGYKGKIVQYICPTVWAHGKQRINTMSQTLDLLLTIFPFEPSCFSHTTLPVKYIGNPLIKNIRTYPYQEHWHKQVGLASTDKLIAIFPGSRIGEIQRNLPSQLNAGLKLKNKYPDIKFALSYAHEELLKPIQELIKDNPLNENIFLVPKSFTYELMRDCHLALAKSGTVTLELALHQRPSVIVYQLSKLNYWMAKYILRLRLPYYCIVNILAGKEVFPELIGQHIDEMQLYTHLERLYTNEPARLNILKDCFAIQAQLGEQDANEAAAKAIQELLENTK